MEMNQSKVFLINTHLQMFLKNI